MNHAPAQSVCAAAALLAIGASALAQPAIYSNASAQLNSPALNSQSTTGSGVSAAPGTFWSEPSAISVSESNALAGVSGHAFGTAGAYRFSDDFTIPAGRTWEVQAISFYAYQPGALGPNSPFATLNLQIWNGPPNNGASSVVWGDTSTNRLTASTNTSIFRIFNTIAAPPTTPEATRPIWRLDAAVGTTLAEGTYWLDWQVASVDPLGEAFSPTATVVGVRTQGSWNALQFEPAAPPGVGGVWSPITDPGKPSVAPDLAQALPFILRGVVNGCAADFNYDGVMSITDIFSMLGAWFAHDPRADWNHNGSWDVPDVFAYLASWFAGCV